jgi:hypothetical protein
MALVLLLAADVALYFAATLTAPADTPTGHDPTSTISTVFTVLFWCGVVALVVLLIATLARPFRSFGRSSSSPGFFRRAAETYAYSTEGLGKAVADVQIGASQAESDERNDSTRRER